MLMIEVVATIPHLEASMDFDAFAPLESVENVISRERYPLRWALNQVTIARVSLARQQGAHSSHASFARAALERALTILQHSRYLPEYQQAIDLLSIARGERRNPTEQTRMQHIRELQSGQRSAGAIHILKALALLDIVQVVFLPEERLKRIAIGVFKLEASDWYNSLNELCHSGWLKRIAPTNDGQMPLIRTAPQPYARYLNETGIYTASNRDLDNDLAQLIKVLSSDPVDTGTLARLSTGYVHNLARVDSSRVTSLALRGVETAAKALANQPEKLTGAARRAAEIHTHLALAHEMQPFGDPVQHIETAIREGRYALHRQSTYLYPLDRVRTLLQLARHYRTRLRESRSENIEHAIAYLEEAHSMLDPDIFPQMMGCCLTELAEAYLLRERDDRDENIQRCVEYALQAIDILHCTNHPKDWVTPHILAGTAYVRWNYGSHYRNFRAANYHFNIAREEYQRKNRPLDWLLVQMRLCEMYTRYGDDSDSFAKAIAHGREAVDTFDDFEYGSLAYSAYWVEANYHLGRAYQAAAPFFAERDYATKTIEHLQMAMPGWLREANPLDYRSVQLAIAETEADRGRWAKASEAYDEALNAEDELVVLGPSVYSRDALLRSGRDVAARAGYVLAKTGRWSDAIVGIERARVRDLAAAIMFDNAAPEYVNDPDQQRRLREAKDAMIAAQRSVNAYSVTGFEQHRPEYLRATAEYHAAQQKYNQVIDEIRLVGESNVFSRTPLTSDTIFAAARQIGERHAIVYLMATPWGGMALAAYHGQCAPPLELPGLTSERMDSLCANYLDGAHDKIIGGLAYAQTTNALQLLRRWHGRTPRESATHLWVQCAESNVTSTLNEAVQEVLEYKRFAELADKPYLTSRPDSEERAELEKYQSLAKQFESLGGTLSQHFLQIELKRAIQAIEPELKRLGDWLADRNISSVTLVTCGQLTMLPLAVILGQHPRLVDKVPISITPGARVMVPRPTPSPPRSGVRSLGDTTPLAHPLPWSRRQAQLIEHIFKEGGVPSEKKVGDDATRSWLIQALRESQIVDASCHGVWDGSDILRSHLVLANEEWLSVRDILGRVVDLYGLRLVMLSACQLGVIDLNGARDEMRNLATAMLQAGAQAVLAAQWPVDDHATFLLLTRFTQEWQPQYQSESPAAALARAQKWLREATYNDIAKWKASYRNEYIPATSEQVLQEQEFGVPLRGSDLTAWHPRTPTDESIKDIEALVYNRATSGDDPGECPYADPIFWAGFQIIGW
jgi:CHAT domain-containing protein